MTVICHNRLLFVLLFWVPVYSIQNSFPKASGEPICAYPYACIPTSDCAERHSVRGTEEVLFQCEGKKKVCCPPIKRNNCDETREDCRNSYQPNVGSERTEYPIREVTTRVPTENNHKRSEPPESRRPAQAQTTQRTFQPQSTFKPMRESSYEQSQSQPAHRPLIETSYGGTGPPQPSARPTQEDTYKPLKPQQSANRPIKEENFRPLQPQPQQPSNRPVQQESFIPLQPQQPFNRPIQEENFRPSQSQQPPNRPTQEESFRPPQSQPPFNRPEQEENFRPAQPLQPTDRPEIRQTTPRQRPRPQTLSENSQSSPIAHRNLGLLPTESNCGENNLNNRITEGEEVALGEYPWMVLTGLKDKYGNYRWNCGGTLINERYVLTAAHCVVVDNRTIEYVRLGEHSLANETDCSPDKCLDSPVDIKISEVIPHEKWNTTTIKNDIALLRLAENPLKLGRSNIQPICLPLNRQKLNITSSTKYIIAGWGKTDWNADEGSDVLRKAFISGVSREECNICKDKKKQQYCPIVDTQLCVQGWKSVDVCKGDSGGPLMFVWSNIYQIGITSFKGSEYCGAENIPSIFTKVEKYLHWILDNLRP